MNKEVNFNLAKLLNTKGLPGTKVFYDNEKHYSLNSEKYTIADVIMWLYETHGIWISCTIWEEAPQFLSKIFIMNDIKESGNFGSFNSLTEAYEGAIEYTLNNLI